MTSVQNRASRGKFLALLASLAMIAAGLVGLVSAPAASATPNWALECGQFPGWVQDEDNFEKLNGSLQHVEGATKVTASFTSGKWAGTWSSTRYVLGVVVKSGDKSNPSASGAPGTSGTWTTQKTAELSNEYYQDLSHLTFCFGTQPPPQTQTVYWCEAGVAKSGEQSSTNGGSTWSPTYNGGDVKTTPLTNADCKTPTPDPTPDPKPEVITYRDSATLSTSQDICTVNGTVTVDVKGFGLGESKVSQPDAKKVAEGNARLDLDYNMKMAKAQFPGATEGACAPVTPTVVEPAIVEPPVEEPLAVTVPANATVQEAPKAVAVPAAATVPAAVPAGEGPADSGFPTWALMLIVLGAAGAAITGVTALKKQ